MRSKNILSTVTFVAAFGLSAAFASLFIGKNTYTYSSASNSTNYCRHRQKAVTADAIEALIIADEANARARSGKMYDIGESYPPAPDSVAFADYAQAIEEYVDDSSRETTADLPSDFKAAWREHLKAWREYSNFLNKSADISGRHSLTAEEFDDADAFYSMEINETFGKVLEIGNDYGADVR